jgi:hypothetical protein
VRLFQNFSAWNSFPEFKGKGGCHGAEFYKKDGKVPDGSQNGDHQQPGCQQRRF